MDLAPLRPVLIAAAAGVLALLVAWPAARLARVLGRRRLPVLLVIGRICRRPLLVTVVVLTVAAAIQGTAGVTEGWRHA